MDKDLFIVPIVKKFFQNMNPTFWNGKGDIPDTFDPRAWQYSLTENVNLEIAFVHDQEEGWKHYCDLINNCDDSSFAVLSGVGIHCVSDIADTVIDLCKNHMEELKL